jgi:hypothetical protein
MPDSGTKIPKIPQFIVRQANRDYFGALSDANRPYWEEEPGGRWITDRPDGHRGTFPDPILIFESSNFQITLTMSDNSPLL